MVESSNTDDLCDQLDDLAAMEAKLTAERKAKAGADGSSEGSEGTDAVDLD